MPFPALTPALLLNALKNISSARSERECTEALVTGASMLQNAVLTKQDPAELVDMLSDVPEEFSPIMAEVFGRAVDFHHLDDGLLGLWLLPVTISTEDGFVAPVSLGAGVPSIRTGAFLVEQLGLTPAQLGGTKAGWVYTIPALYSAEQLSAAEFSALVTLPGAARRVVQGEVKGLTFRLDHDECPAGGNVLYMPFVAYSPAGQDGVFELSEKVKASATKWVRESLAANGISASATVSVNDLPRPYSEMMNEAPIQSFCARLRYFLYLAVKNSGCQPQAMVAHLSPYATPQTGGELILGINFRSRLTRQLMGNITMPTFSEGAAAELGEAVGMMRAMGFARVMVSKSPIQSLMCQSCGSLQMQVPPDALMDSMTPDSSTSYH